MGKYRANDPKKVKARGEKEDKEHLKEVEDLKEVMSTESGRRFIWRLLSKCHVFSSIWDNSARIHYLEGQRNIGLMLIHDLDEVDPTSIFKMALEEKDRKDNERLNEQLDQ